VFNVLMCFISCFLLWFMLFDIIAYCPLFLKYFFLPSQENIPPSIPPAEQSTSVVKRLTTSPCNVWYTPNETSNRRRKYKTPNTSPHMNFLTFWSFPSKNPPAKAETT